MLIDGSLVLPVRTVQNLEVFIDTDLVTRSHVTRIVAQCFAVLRQLRAHQSAAVAIDVKNSSRRVSPISTGLRRSVLTGLPAYLVKRLQSVLNASARLIYGLRPFDHISNALLSLHWLRIPERIQFKLAVLVMATLQNTSDRSLGCLTFRVDHHCDRHHPII